MELRKLIETKKNGEYETKKFHILNIKIDNKISSEIEELIENIDDYEELYYTWGISSSFDDLIYCVDLNRFVEKLENDVEEDEDEDDGWKTLKVKIIKLFKKYESYTLYWINKQEGEE